MKIATWLLRIGYWVIVVAVALFLGVADLLPVDLWLWFEGLWSGTSPPRYMRVVPAEASNTLEWGLLVAGLLVVAAGWTIKLREKQG